MGTQSIFPIFLSGGFLRTYFNFNPSNPLIPSRATILVDIYLKVLSY